MEKTILNHQKKLLELKVINKGVEHLNKKIQLML